jgi:predicted ribosome quality control (RQC) complex YloA/Tae2 family protein
VLPPVMTGGEDLKPSPFLKRLTEALGCPPTPDRPVLSPGNGAYPASVAPLGLPELGRGSISIALEQHFDQAIPAHEADALRTTLVHQLERVVLARDVALEDLRKAEAAGGRAPEWQHLGELILAYGPSAPPGAKSVMAWDYDGTERELALDPTLNFKENANRYFERAKKAKGRLGMVRDQIARLSDDREAVAALLQRVIDEPRLDRLRDLQEEARRKRYLTNQTVPAKAKEDRPYEGHRVRELTGPGGWTVLYGENAESNDYLTLRVAKPNDWWLHIRGGVSAHVIVVTRNQPDRVQRETLEFAAKVAVQNSPSKHAGYVPVDYTLKKYVRKPRGAPKGTALYTHEKTLHVGE